MLHREEPLLTETRLYCCILIALAVAHLVLIVLHLFQQASFLQVDGDLLAHIHAVHSHVEWTLVADGTIRVEDVDGLEVVGLTQCIVVYIVGRRHFQTACSEFDIHIAVLDNRNHTVHQWHDDFLATQPLILRVFGVDTHRRIAHDGLRTCGSNHCVVALLILVDDIFCALSYLCALCHIIFQIKQLALLVFVDDLLAREHGLCLRIPVHHTQATIDKALVVEVYEHLQHTLATRFVHCEGCAVPIARCTQTAQLLQDDASVLVRPVPCMLQELFTSQVALLDALLSQFVHHLSLSSDTCVVGTWYPTSVFSVNTSLTNQDILNRVVEHVSHMEHTRHIWWRNHNRIRFSVVGFA